MAKKVKVKPGCDGCYYWKQLYRDLGSPKCCQYMLIEGEQRGCEAGINCSRRLELNNEETRIKDRKYQDKMFKQADHR